MNIVICDDMESDANIAKKIIKETAREIPIHVEFDYYSKAADVERRFLKKHELADILILDIDMPEISGLELAERLRREMKDLLIIFLSSYEEFVFKAIEFQPFRYIRKICINTEMPLAIQSAYKILKLKQAQQISLKTADGERKELLSDIMYIESENRKVSIHLVNGINYTANHKMADIQNMIISETFLMIHRSCIVNSDYVKNISNGILILDNDEKLVISRLKYKEVKQNLLKLWGDLL